MGPRTVRSVHLFLFVSTLAGDTCLDRTCSCCRSGHCIKEDVIGSAICDGCIDGYTGQNCLKPCPANCFNCSQTYFITEKICQACKNGFYNGHFKDIAAFFPRTDCSLKCKEHCQTCSSFHNCAVCEDGHFLDPSSDCKMCPSQCKICTSANACKACIDGYFLRNNDCHQCKDSCKTCDSYDRCSACYTGFYLKDTECRKCNPGCLHCDGEHMCKFCKMGHYLVGNQCKQCNGYCSECALYTNNDPTCRECHNGYYLSNNQCFKCGIGCTSCKTEHECLECDRNHTIINGKCNTCHSMCTTCLNNSVCISCQTGYYVDEKYCATCSKNCVSCVSAKSCTACKEGYYGEDCSNDCPLTCYNKDCHQTTGKCVSCANGYYFDDKKNCVKCPETCLTCMSKDTCETCQKGYMGQACQDKCSACAPKTACNKTNGYCYVACMDGIGGIHCNVSCDSRCLTCNRNDHRRCTVCLNNTFGDTCTDACPYMCLNKKCQATTAECAFGCMIGYWGSRCEKNCSRNCRDDNCDQATGKCKEGCKQGYDGSFCIEALEEKINKDTGSVNSTTLNIGVLTGSAGILLVLIPIIGGLVYKKRRGKRATKRAREAIEDLFPSLEDDDLVELDLEESDGYLHPSYEPASKKEDEDKYYNTLALRKRKTNEENLEAYVNNKTHRDYLDEFLQLPSNLMKPVSVAQKKENLLKNRYRGIYPYDSTMVTLKSSATDYINASYIDGYNKWREYIASVGPTAKYMVDMSVFWDMIWEEKSSKIVMLTNLEEPQAYRCDRYWPRHDHSCLIGTTTVVTKSEDKFKHYTIRKFDLKRNSETKQVTQFHFTSWWEKKVPGDVLSLLEFRQRVNSGRSHVDSPIIVHCSSGVGRSGTYIALDMLIHELESEGQVDVFACVRNLREQRVKMVQTVEQYKFIHQALLHSLSLYTQLEDKRPSARYSYEQCARGQNVYTYIQDL